MAGVRSGGLLRASSGTVTVVRIEPRRDSHDLARFARGEHAERRPFFSSEHSLARQSRWMRAAHAGFRESGTFS
jgi:hypothetical protein